MLSQLVTSHGHRSWLWSGLVSAHLARRDKGGSPSCWALIVLTSPHHGAGALSFVPGREGGGWLLGHERCWPLLRPLQGFRNDFTNPTSARSQEQLQPSQLGARKQLGWWSLLPAAALCQELIPCESRGTKHTATPWAQGININPAEFPLYFSWLTLWAHLLAKDHPPQHGAQK